MEKIFSPRLQRGCSIATGSVPWRSLFAYMAVRPCPIFKVPAPGSRDAQTGRQRCRHRSTRASDSSIAGGAARYWPNWKPGTGRQCAGCDATVLQKKNRLSSVSVCRTNGNVTASGSLAEWGLHTVSSTPRFPSERGPRPCRNRDRYLLARKSQP